MSERVYTHIDEDGMRWRFEGSRPVSKLADGVMDAVEWLEHAAYRSDPTPWPKAKRVKARP